MAEDTEGGFRPDDENRREPRASALSRRSDSGSTGGWVDREPPIIDGDFRFVDDTETEGFGQRAVRLVGRNKLLAFSFGISFATSAALLLTSPENRLINAPSFGVGFALGGLGWDVILKWAERNRTGDKLSMQRALAYIGVSGLMLVNSSMGYIEYVKRYNSSPDGQAAVAQQQATSDKGDQLTQEQSGSWLKGAQLGREQKGSNITATPAPRGIEVPSSTQSSNTAPEVKRPGDITPEEWAGLSARQQKDIAENRARIRANADIAVGREPSPTIAPEKTPDFRTAIAIAGTPPAAPYSGPEGTGIGRTGVGVVDTALNIVDAAWIGTKLAVGIGIILVIWRVVPRLVLEAIKLPFKAAGFAFGVIGRLIGAGINRTSNHRNRNGVGGDTPTGGSPGGGTLLGP